MRTFTGMVEWPREAREFSAWLKMRGYTTGLTLQINEPFHKGYKALLHYVPDADPKLPTQRMIAHVVNGTWDELKRAIESEEHVRGDSLLNSGIRRKRKRWGNAEFD